jgi:hypothetical protein
MAGLPRPLFTAITGFLLLVIAYYNNASPLAVRNRGTDLHHFASQVENVRTDKDRILFFDYTGNGIRFLLGLNRPSVSLDEIRLFMDRHPDDGEVYIVAMDEKTPPLLKQWPDRFEEMLSHPWSPDHSLVLLRVRPHR